MPKKTRPEPFCFALPCSVPIPPPVSPICDVICNSLRGNILLNDSVTTLEIWRGEISRKSTVTIAMFNSALSISSIKVIITQGTGDSVEFTVPPGNTLSATVDDVKSITVLPEGIGIIEGRYCLEICFAISR